eukprot:gene9392-1603_t
MINKPEELEVNLEELKSFLIFFSEFIKESKSPTKDQDVDNIKKGQIALEKIVSNDELDDHFVNQMDESTLRDVIDALSLIIFYLHLDSEIRVLKSDMGLLPNIVFDLKACSKVLQNYYSLNYN